MIARKKKVGFFQSVRKHETCFHKKAATAAAATEVKEKKEKHTCSSLLPSPPSTPHCLPAAAAVAMPSLV